MYAVGLQDDKPSVRYVPESDYNDLRDRSQQQIKDAYSNGYSDGLQAGLARGQEESRKICSELNALLSDVRKQRGEIYRQAELEIVELAHAIASRIVSVQVEAEPSIVIESARKAVKLLLDRSKLVVKVSPMQEQFVRENLDKLLEIDDRIERIEIEADRRVSPGGCMLETESGNVDARIETELGNIANILRKTNMSLSED